MKRWDNVYEGFKDASLCSSESCAVPGVDGLLLIGITKLCPGMKTFRNLIHFTWPCTETCRKTSGPWAGECCSMCCPATDSSEPPVSNSVGEVQVHCHCHTDVRYTQVCRIIFTCSALSNVNVRACMRWWRRFCARSGTTMGHSVCWDPVWASSVATWARARHHPSLASCQGLLCWGSGWSGLSWAKTWIPCSRGRSRDGRQED